MRNVEEANHILYGCIVIGSNPILTSKRNAPISEGIGQPGLPEGGKFYNPSE